MRGRICVITGASSGIGLATALGLAQLGASLRITGRDPDRLAEAKRALEAEGADVVTFQADFSSLTAVRRLSRELLIRGEPLHVLVHNAGVYHRRFVRSVDASEDTFAVNHLAPFLLTHRLLGRMVESGPSRIVHVSSRLHAQAGQTRGLLPKLVHAAAVLKIPLSGAPARLELDRVDAWRGYDGLAAYARSKLAQVLFSNELARRLEGTAVTSNAVHPGSVQTNVVRDRPWLAGLNARFGHLVLKSPEEGARTSVRVASDQALEGVTGRYFADAREAEASPTAADPELAHRLWTFSEERVGLRLDETPIPLRRAAFYPA